MNSLLPIRDLSHTRLTALRASSLADEARQAEAWWRTACEPYCRALHDGPASGSVRIESHGLTYFIPPSQKRSALAERLSRGSLPWGELAAQGLCGTGGIALDIGANIGITSMLKVVCGDAQRVYAAEPEPANYRNLVAAVSATGLGGFVLPDWLALSDRTGTATLKVASRMANHTLRDDTTGGITVPTMTLDDWVSVRHIETARISVVKVDTQGAECRILRGAPSLLACPHIAWVLEFSPKHLAAFGSAVADFFAVVAVHFTHVVDLDADDVTPFRTSEMPSRLASVGSKRRFTNLLLYSSHRT